MSKEMNIEINLDSKNCTVGLKKLNNQLIGVTNSIAETTNQCALFKDGASTAIKRVTHASSSLKEFPEVLNTISNNSSRLSNNIGNVDTSLYQLSASIQATKNNSINWGEVLSTISEVSEVISSISGVISFIPGKIGAAAKVISAVSGGISALTGFAAEFVKTSSQMTNGSYNVVESLGILQQISKENLELDLAQISRTQELSTELGTLVDTNGKVKVGYEERANSILVNLNEACGTEYQLIDGVITKNGEQVTSYQEVKDSIESIITIRKAQSVLNAFEAEYNTNLLAQKDLVGQINEEQERHKTKLEEISGHYEEYLDQGMSAYDAMKKCESEANTETERHRKSLQDLQGQYDSNHKSVEKWENLQAAVISGNVEEAERLTKGFVDTSSTSYDTLFKDLSTSSSITKQEFDEIFKDITKTHTLKLDADTEKACRNIICMPDKIGTINVRTQYTPYHFYNDKNYKEKGGVYVNGSWSSIPQYANGGLPNHGTMFIAGERGAEIVGHINGRTEVLNRSQIASSIYTAVATAMSQYGGTNQDIRVYAEEGLIVEKVSKGINQHVKQTGSLPFVIPI